MTNAEYQAQLKMVAERWPLVDEYLNARVKFYQENPGYKLFQYKYDVWHDPVFLAEWQDYKQDYKRVFNQQFK